MRLNDFLAEQKRHEAVHGFRVKTISMPRAEALELMDDLIAGADTATAPIMPPEVVRVVDGVRERECQFLMRIAGTDVYVE